MSASFPNSIESNKPILPGDSGMMESRHNLENVTKANLHMDHDSLKSSSNAANDNSSPDDDGNSTDALADAFSFSLAHIAATGRHRMQAAAPITNSDESHTNATAGHPAKKSFASANYHRTTSSDDRGDSSEVDDLRHYPCHDITPYADSERPHFHRRKRPCGRAETMETGISAPLLEAAVPFRSAEATVVVAPLLIPSLRHVATERIDVNASRHGSTSSLNEENTGINDVMLSSSLVQPYREPCFSTIRQTFHLVGKKGSGVSFALPGNDVKPSRNAIKRGVKRKSVSKLDTLVELPQPVGTGDVCMKDVEYQSGMDSGSEGGYSASYSSNGSCAAGSFDSSSCLSDEESTDDNYKNGRNKPPKGLGSGDPMRPMLSKKQESSPLSSDIADFSSSFSVHASKARSDSPSFTSSSNLGDEDENSDKNEVVRASSNRGRIRLRRVPPVWMVRPQPSPTSMIAENGRRRFYKRARFEDLKAATVSQALPSSKTLDGKIPILALGCDVMAHVLTFLEPPEVLDALTMPLSKGWLLTFTRQPELWRVLCLLEPFKAQIRDDDESAGSCYSSSDDESDFPHSFSTAKSSKFRLQYASYVRCMRCLDRIKEDAISGRPLSVVDYSAVLKESRATATTTIQDLGTNQNLQQFLARARGITTTPSKIVAPVDSSEPVTRSASMNVVRRSNDKPKLKIKNFKTVQVPQEPASAPKEKKVKFGHSKLTQRLLGPTLTGTLGDVELPWTYGIYSIVNWMVAYSDVEGIQTMCLRVLPLLLENEQQRITAQRAGLTDIVLRDMVLFPESVILHTAAFHTIVLLARPLGGQEGMLFHTSMVNSSGIFGSTADGSVGGKSGIAVLIDSMRRFSMNESLQSMACWSLVNIALAPSQKEVLVKLGGIEVIAHAMKEHQYSADVQFRALFALINLVIPSVTSGNLNNSDENLDEDLGIDSTEKEMLDELVDQIIGLVVLAMKNYCSHEAILNRACLVLHNLSLTPCYHSSILWTPNCYQMLEWCLSNYRTDQVLQQSAAGTLHRLQTTLSNDEALRLRFVSKLQTQQNMTAEQENQDALTLQGQQ